MVIFNSYVKLPVGNTRGMGLLHYDWQLLIDPLLPSECRGSINHHGTIHQPGSRWSWSSRAAKTRGGQPEGPPGHCSESVPLKADFLEIQNHTLSPSQIITFTSLSRCQWHHHVWAKALRTKRSSCSMGDHGSMGSSEREKYQPLSYQKLQTSAELRLNFMLTKYHEFLKHHGMWWTTVDGCEILHHQPDETMRNRLSTRAGFRNHPPYGSVSKPCTPGEHQNSW